VRGTTRIATTIAAGALALVGLDASAQTGIYSALPGAQQAPQRSTQILPSISTEIDVTDNVDLAPTDRRRSDVILQVTPALAISHRGAHATLNGTISAPILLYARTGAENNAVRPQVNLYGTAELAERILFVDAAASVSQQYFSPFGARPVELTSATNNRYTAQSYRVSPYVKHDDTDGLSYELRDDNIWTNATGTPVATNNAYTNDIRGTLTRAARPLGWSLQYRREDTQFQGQGSLLTESERASALWGPDPQYQLSLTGGYENNRYPLASYSNAIVGAGIKWRPDGRTDVDAAYEHRFFGASYHVSFDHHTPLSVWTLRAFRDITSTPQRLADLAAGADVSSLLNQLFGSRISDPAQRQAAVDQLIRDRGLPTVLDSPLDLFTQQITLQESIQGTAGLLGARNSVFFTAYRTRNEPITSAAASPIDFLNSHADNTQTGVNVAWNHALTALYVLSVRAGWAHTVANDLTEGRANQGTLRVIVSAPLSPLTQVFVGARYQRLLSNLGSGYYESAAFAGVNHLFR
jgi:uncharacterized protein (PEP-CTERM system associated)